VRELTRAELTAALAARQMLVERRRVAPAEAIRLLTPLQGQHPPAPFIALAARLDGFAREDLEAAIEARAVVKTTINRLTLHLADAGDYPAFAQLTRQPRMRTWRKVYAHLDEEKVGAELGAWLREPRTNAEIRERVGRYDGVTDDAWTPVIFARTLLPLVQLPPAGFWADPRRAGFVLDPRPLPDPADAAALVLARYLAAFGPASRRDVAAWAGVAQRDFAEAFARVETVTFRDEHGTELFDLPGQPLPEASTKLPPRFLAQWDQPLLAYDRRDRIIPPEVQALKLTLSGDPTVTVDGRVAASWGIDGGRITITPHVEMKPTPELEAEALRTARFCAPDAERWEVVYNQPRSVA
jgi:Winged helix DNA-binding domain